MSISQMKKPKTQEDSINHRIWVDYIQGGLKI